MNKKDIVKKVQDMLGDIVEDVPFKSMKADEILEMFPECFREENKN